METISKPNVKKPIHLDRNSQAYQAHEEFVGLDGMPIGDKLPFIKLSTEPIALAPNEIVGLPKVVIPET
jgi:hypothetical protein